MKTIKVQINLFSLDELEETAKNIAIQDHTNFLISQGIEIENEKGEMENVEYNPTESEVIENININEYLYYSNGELADCTTYTGEHEKSGNTFYNFNGKQYAVD